MVFSGEYEKRLKEYRDKKFYIMHELVGCSRFFSFIKMIQKFPDFVNITPRTIRPVEALQRYMQKQKQNSLTSKLSPSQKEWGDMQDGY
jgi:hypothetical protein